MAARGEVLVVIVNNQADWAIAREQGWYRIPSEQVEKLKHRNQWAPPKWLAFYQTKVFEDEAHAVQYYAAVTAIRDVSRWELFPTETPNSKSHNRYWQVELAPLEALARPIHSDRLRRITFIATTWEKLSTAQEISDL
jgi:hypothetical protein